MVLRSGVRKYQQFLKRLLHRTPSCVLIGNLRRKLLVTISRLSLQYLDQ